MDIASVEADRRRGDPSCVIGEQAASFHANKLITATRTLLIKKSKQEDILRLARGYNKRHTPMLAAKAAGAQSTSCNQDNSKSTKMVSKSNSVSKFYYLLFLTISSLQFALIASSLIGAAHGQQSVGRLPDLVSSTSDEPIVAVIGQDAFISCVAKNLQNYTIIWRYTNEANAPGGDNGGDLQAKQSAALSPAARQSDELGVILTAGRQRVTSDNRISVIQSHDTWLLKISNVRLSDTGTYICQTNSEPRVRALRILSVVKPSPSQTDAANGKCFHLLNWIITFFGCSQSNP